MISIKERGMVVRKKRELCLESVLDKEIVLINSMIVLINSMIVLINSFCTFCQTTLQVLLLIQTKTELLA